MTMTRDFRARPMAGIPEACESLTKVQAAYRFLSDDDVLFETLSQPHCAATEERISDVGKGSVVLVAQDTTSVDCDALESALPIENKESWRWIKGYQAVAAVQTRNPHIQRVSVADREADIHELFEEALREPDSARLLVRAKHNRSNCWQRPDVAQATCAARHGLRLRYIRLPRGAGCSSQVTDTGSRETW